MISLEALLASGIGVITATGVFLLLRGRSWPVALGLNLLGYAVNAFIFVMGRLWLNAAPIVAEHGPTPATLADPLPPALVLTAIVIGFATNGLLIVLALRGFQAQRSDHVDGHEPGGAASQAEADGQPPKEGAAHD